MIKEGPKKISRKKFLKETGIFIAGATAQGIKDKNKIEKLKEEEEVLKKRINELKAEIEKLKEEKRTLEEILKEREKQIETKKLKVIATAYTAGPESTGKTPEDPDYGITFSGWKADIGTIAVDPNIIELGSIVYVPGYGYAIALDTGEAIKGNKIDLFFHNVEDALNWGKKEVEIIVIGKLENFTLATEKLKELGLAK